MSTTRASLPRLPAGCSKCSGSSSSWEAGQNRSTWQRWTRGEGAASVAAQLEWEVKSGLSDLAPLCIWLQSTVGLSVCICSPLPRPQPRCCRLAPCPPQLRSALSSQSTHSRVLSGSQESSSVTTAQLQIKLPVREGWGADNQRSLASLRNRSFQRKEVRNK